MSFWVSSRDPVGGWYWHFPEMPNGWSPSVCDWSQSIAPVQPTEYTISAISKHQIVQGKESYKTLSEAKTEAILFAMLQPDAEAVYREALEKLRA